MANIEPLRQVHIDSGLLRLFSDAASGLLALDARGGVAIVAVEDAQAVGFAAVFETGEVSVNVEPSFQRHGVGTALVREAIALAFRRGQMDRVWASTQTGHPGWKVASGAFERTVAMSDGETRFELTRAEWQQRREI